MKLWIRHWTISCFLPGRRDCHLWCNWKSLGSFFAQKLTLFSASSFEDIVTSRRAWGTREKMQKRKTLFSILLKNDWSFLWVHKTIGKDVARTLGRSVMWRDKNGWEGDSFEGGLLEWGEGRGRLFNLAKMVVALLKEVEFKVEKLMYATEDQK